MSDTGELHSAPEDLILGEPLHKADFERFRQLILARTGIKLGPEKHSLVQGRVSKRLRALGMQSFSQYFERVASAPEDDRELEAFIDVVTTNKTDFFREKHHFEFLANKWIPEMKREAQLGQRQRKLRIWSAACSSGEEPYTIAMTLLDALGADARAWDMRILATDVSSTVLAKAKAGIYSQERVETVPRETLQRHFLRGTGKSAGFVRTRADLQSLITFHRLNFMDAKWPMHARFDLIFCRNALIYFERELQQQLVTRFLQYLAPGGYLILGHSECIHGWFQDLAHLGDTIYRLKPTATSVK